MAKMKKIKIILVFILFLLILPNYTNAAKISIGKVKNVKVKSQTTTSLKISWNSVSKAIGYRVYICEGSGSKYKYYGKTTSKTMTIKNLKSSQKYKIKIRGYKTVKKKNYYGSYSSVLVTSTKPTQVKKLKLKSQTDTTIKLSWNKVSRASGYRVYIYNSSKKKYEYYGYSNTNSITVKNLKSAYGYKIKVRAYRNVNGTRYYGSYSSVLKDTTKPSKIEYLKAKSQNDNSITLTWNKQSRVTGYRVYKYNSSKKKYEYYKYTNNNSLTIKDLKSSQEYKFKVRAYETYNNKNYYGSYSSILTTATKPTVVKNIKVKSQDDTSVSLTWNEVTRATGYRVYIYNSSKKTWDYHSYSKTNSITVKKLTPATIYKINVVAYKQVDNTMVLGPNSEETVETFTKPSKVTNLIEIDNTLTSLKLSWDIISGAAGYKIYMYNSSAKSYEYIGETLSNSYDISNLNPATGYKFKVRAYITYKDVQYFGEYADILDTSTLPNKVTRLESTAQTTNSITIEWDKVDKVNGYAVYIFNDTNQCFKEYKKTTETIMTITDLDTARFYKIYVKSYVVVANKEYYSDESITISQRTLSTDNIKAGIDVSKHQGTIDWNKVKGQVDFAILRLGWIGNGLGDEENHTLDTKFIENYNKCKGLGIPVGVYVYCYSNRAETARSGANWAVKQLEGKTLDLPVFIDMEDKSIAGLGKNKLSNICVEFNNIIAKAGYEPGIYANKNWFDNYLDKELRSKYTCWIAHYTSKDQNYDEEFSIWQYTSKGLINGISGNVDLNIIYIVKKEGV